MGRNAVETVLGAVVLAVAALFVFFAYSSAEIRDVDGYRVTAKFLKVGGLAGGSDVRVNGIKVGTVSGLALDRETFAAIVELTIRPDVKLPADTVAAIGSEGVIGGKYVRLEPGPSAERIPPGGRIEKTRDFKSLEDQVSEIIFLATGGK